MKKISLLLLTVTLCAAGFTSCLSSGGNSESGGDIGILEYNSTFKLVMKTGGGNVIYSPDFSSLEPNGCYYVYYTIDYDAAENASSVVSANGYYTVTVSGCYEVDKYEVNSFLTDTASVLADEIPIKDGWVTGQIYGYAGGYLFFAHTVTVQSDLQISWDLSYDYETMMPTTDGDNRYYDVFLRAVPKNTSDKTSTSDIVYLNAYRMESYLYQAARIEKERLGNSYTTASLFTLRVNYASDISSEGEITWSSKTMSFYIASFISN